MQDNPDSAQRLHAQVRVLCDEIEGIIVAHDVERPSRIVLECGTVDRARGLIDALHDLKRTSNEIRDARVSKDGAEPISAASSQSAEKLQGIDGVRSVNMEARMWAFDASLRILTGCNSLEQWNWLTQVADKMEKYALNGEELVMVPTVAVSTAEQAG